MWKKYYYQIKASLLYRVRFCILKSKVKVGEMPQWISDTGQKKNKTARTL